MKAFWNDCGRGPNSDAAKEVDLNEARLIWSDKVRGVQGNFLGLIDSQGNTIQFYFDVGIPDNVDDASHLRIVLMDFPQPARKGSCALHVTIMEVQELIEKAFQVGADYRQFGNLTFMPW
jgi:hypothetical protein